MNATHSLVFLGNMYVLKPQAMGLVIKLNVLSLQNGQVSGEGENGFFTWVY